MKKLTLLLVVPALFALSTMAKDAPAIKRQLASRLKSPGTKIEREVCKTALPEIIKAEGPGTPVKSVDECMKHYDVGFVDSRGQVNHYQAVGGTRDDERVTCDVYLPASEDSGFEMNIPAPKCELN